MSRHQIECIACEGSFNSEKEYSMHNCKTNSNEFQIKDEPIEEDYEIEDVVVKLEPQSLLELSEEDPLSFITVKEEILSYDNACKDKENETGAMRSSLDMVTAEPLSAVASEFMSNNTNLKCNTCSKTFQNYKTFNQHVISAHATFKPYSCNICGKKFLQKHYVTLHMRVHTGERPYACPICPKKYTHKTSFTIHMRIHKGERPYECGVCGKKCYDKSGLTSHIRSHTKETPYKCDVCERRFTHSKSLLVHKRNHTGEKPYICRYCGKAFRHWHKHKIHVRLHTGERPYKCKVCGKGFPRNDEVKRHMRSHTGIKSFRCSICGAYCATQSSITGHINLHHSNLKTNEPIPQLAEVEDKPSGVLGNSTSVSEIRSSIYSNIAQQSSYVAKILMTAKNGKQSRKKNPSTKVIEITTNDPPSLRSIKPKGLSTDSLRFDPSNEIPFSKTIKPEQSLDYQEFMDWQEKMLKNQGLVVKGLPADEESKETTSLKKSYVEEKNLQSQNLSIGKQPLSNLSIGKQQLPNLSIGNQQYLLVAQQGTNATASKLLVPIKSLTCKKNKLSNDMIGMSTMTNNKKIMSSAHINQMEMPLAPLNKLNMSLTTNNKIGMQQNNLMGLPSTFNNKIRLSSAANNKIGISSTKKKPYLLVPESVAAQPMFLLSSGSQKMVLLASQQSNQNHSLTFDSSPNSISSTKIKMEKEETPPSSPNETDSSLTVKIEPKD